MTELDPDAAIRVGTWLGVLTVLLLVVVIVLLVVAV
jgi:hypothetical protein